jgi:O-antigen ligase
VINWATYPLLAYGFYLVLIGTTQVAAVSILFLIVSCYHLIQWKAGSTWGFIAGILFFLINVLTSARSPAAVGLGLFVLVELILGRGRRWLKIFSTGGGLLGIGILFFLYYPPFRQSFLQGDNALQVGEVAINTAGRIRMWELTIESWLTSPWIGVGIDAPPDVLYAGGQGHPHNDYLRLLHHLGIFGLLSWLFFYVRLVKHFWKFWKRNRERLIMSLDIRLIGITLMTTVAIGLIMLTDNPIVYSYIMYPLAILTGASIGVMQPQS